jgi:glycerol-3-phosphate dehydrogenase
MPIGGGRDYPEDEKAQKQWVANLAHQTGISEERAQTLFERYGTYAQRVAEFIAAGDDQPLTDKPDYSEREIVFAVRNEKVETLQDIVLRRSLLAMLGKLSLNLLAELADIIGEEHGWSETERQRQVEMTVQRLKTKNVVEIHEDRMVLIGHVPTEDEVEVIPENALVVPARNPSTQEA